MHVFKRIQIVHSNPQEKELGNKVFVAGNWHSKVKSYPNLKFEIAGKLSSLHTYPEELFVLTE